MYQLSRTKRGSGSVTFKLFKENVLFNKDARWVVEANSFEYHTLWKTYLWSKTVSWEENPSGYGVTVGFLDNRPVCIFLRTAKIDNKDVIFIDATSVVVDWNMINEYINKRFPSARTIDANNFHQIITEKIK